MDDILKSPSTEKIYGKTLKFINEYEYNRTEENLFKIYLEKSGEWFKGLEFSVYLYNILSLPNKLAVNKYALKDLPSGYLQCGFKAKSFSKFFVGIDEKNIKFIPDKNTAKAIHIDVSDLLKDHDITLDNYKEILEKYKDNISYSQNNFNNVKKEENREYSIKAIMQDILAYPIESKTLIQNTQFISDLKLELSKLL